MKDYAASSNAPPQTPGSQMAIVMENLTVSYGAHQVLKGVSLEVPVGSIFGFLGANGAGRTTTIKTFLGFGPPDAGKACGLGYEVARSAGGIWAGGSDVSEVSSRYSALSRP